MGLLGLPGFTRNKTFRAVKAEDQSMDGMQKERPKQKNSRCWLAVVVFELVFPKFWTLVLVLTGDKSQGDCPMPTCKLFTA